VLRFFKFLFKEYKANKEKIYSAAHGLCVVERPSMPAPFQNSSECHRTREWCRCYFFQATVKNNSLSGHTGDCRQYSKVNHRQVAHYKRQNLVEVATLRLNVCKIQTFENGLGYLPDRFTSLDGYDV
jgi:hypothetical protein